MLIVHVHVRVSPGRTGDFLAATLVNARASLAEPGVLRFDVIQDQADPAHVVLTEVYRDEQAPAAHKLTPHYVAWRDAVAEMMAEPRQSVRDFGVKLKLNPVRSLLQGNRVILIDDSIVRGTTSKKIVRLIRNAGATEVHMRISCPPTISPCFYGVDTPSKKQLIAANKSIEEIRAYIGADSLAYLSLEGLKKACGEGETTTYCSACYTGKYPTSWVDVDEILPAQVSE